MKNMYEPHPFMIDSGTFWRCEHGTTGYVNKNNETKWVGCKKCAQKKPLTWLKHRIHNLLN
jgi:hypothetical protein